MSNFGTVSPNKHFNKKNRNPATSLEDMIGSNLVEGHARDCFTKAYENPASGLNVIEKMVYCELFIALVAIFVKRGKVIRVTLVESHQRNVSSLMFLRLPLNHFIRLNRMADTAINSLSSTMSLNNLFSRTACRNFKLFHTNVHLMNFYQNYLNRFARLNKMATRAINTLRSELFLKRHYLLHRLWDFQIIL